MERVKVMNKPKKSIIFILVITYLCMLLSICCINIYTNIKDIPTSTPTVTSTVTFTATIQPLKLINTVTLTSTLTPLVTSTKTLIPTDTRWPTKPYSTPVLQAEHPYGTSGKCVDGTYTKSDNRQGACSHHDGLSEWWGK